MKFTLLVVLYNVLSRSLKLLLDDIMCDVLYIIYIRIDVIF